MGRSDRHVGGLLNFRNGQFHKITGLDSDLIWLIRDSAGILWVVTADNGLYCLAANPLPWS